MSSTAPRMRLLVLSRDLTVAEGGVATFVRTELRYLRERVQAQHFTIGRRGPEETRSKRLVRLVADTARLSRALRESKADVVQLNPSLTTRSLLRDGVFCLLATRAGRRRVVAVFHGWDSDLAKRVSRNVSLRSLFRMSFGRAAAVVVLAPSFAEEAVRMGVRPESIHTVTTMFDETEFAALRDRVPDKENLLLFMSRLVREKGASELVDAFASGAKTMWPDWKLVIAGDGPARAELAKQVERTGLGDRIELVGYVKGAEKVELLKRAAVFALPTRYNEGIPISVLESMASGCALITSKAGGLGSIVRDAEHGVVLEQILPQSLDDALRRMLLDPAFRDHAQRACHNLAWCQLSSSVVTEKLEQILRDESDV